MAAFIVLQTSLRLLYPLADYAVLHADDAALSLFFMQTYDTAYFLFFFLLLLQTSLRLLYPLADYAASPFLFAAIPFPMQAFPFGISIPICIYIYMLY